MNRIEATRESDRAPSARQNRAPPGLGSRHGICRLTSWSNPLQQEKRCQRNTKAVRRQLPRVTSPRRALINRLSHKHQRNPTAHRHPSRIPNAGWAIMAPPGNLVSNNRVGGRGRIVRSEPTQERRSAAARALGMCQEDARAAMSGDIESFASPIAGTTLPNQEVVPEECPMRVGQCFRKRRRTLAPKKQRRFRRNDHK